MKRDSYISLDGIWKLNGEDILVPFPPESEASGYNGVIDEKLIYETTFTFIPTGKRLLLNFGAVDECCTVYVNGTGVGSHEGGYLPFSLDITSYVKEGTNDLKVDVTDGLSHVYPYGKQKKDRGGMWYTPVSGIWQTVWLEEVPERYIKSIKTYTTLNGADITYTVSDSDEVLHKTIEIKSPVLWTPENPYLYYEKISYGEDEVETYFALREIKTERIGGKNRVTLNGNPVFLHGVLDQGYHKDGIFIPTNPDEIENDVIRMKSLGFNTLRKHIKIEPEKFYYECDRHGMLVIQDMPNSGDYSFFRDTVLGTIGLSISDKTGLAGKRKEFFISHCLEVVEYLHNHPSVVGYTIFNEGWGQFESDYMYKLLKEKAPDRLFDSTSGWFKQKLSDFDSEHVYFRTKALKPKSRPFLLSECGGYTLPISERLTTEKKYGYGACASKEELTDKIVSMYEKMVIPFIKDGVAGCIYTQLSDIEDEINGLYTYDREEIKVSEDKMRALSLKIYNEIEKIK